MNVLFLCGRNQWRSPTAEQLYARVPGVAARSRGLASSARRRVTAADVAWADVVFVMEDAHRRRLARDFRDALGARPVHVLDIPDEYGFQDPELVELIRAGVDPVLFEADEPDQPDEDGEDDEDERDDAGA